MSPDDLNPPQAEAVATLSGPLLVFAGAGSGKTRVITYRIANLVACERVAPYRVLAVTFTNKAAGEMRGRLARLLGDDVARDLWVGTFHAISAKLLRRHGEALGLKSSFVIYDTDDQRAVVNRALRALGIDDNRYPPRTCLAAIHKEKQELRGPDEMETGDPWLPKIYRLYEEQLRAANAVDFEDLIGLMVRLLEEPSGEGQRAGDALRRRFQYVLVDEFQDTNAAQYRFLKGFVRDHRNLCVVGDDDQSIYKWRGADVRNIRNFKKDFPEAHVVKLEQNYRSTSRIVKAALAVIEKSTERVPKDLWTANAEGAPIDVVATRDERDEASVMLHAIQEARARGVDPKEIAVFYRVHAQSRVLEEALLSANVPYQIVGGIKFYERAEIKTALAYLRVLTTPESDVDFLRIVNTPARGIGATSVERLVAYADELHTPVTTALERVVTDLPALAKGLGLGAASQKLASLHRLLEDLRKDASSRAPSATLEHVLERTGFVTALEAEGSAESEARLENLAELVGSMRDYEAETEAAGERPSLEGFLERVSLQSDVDGMKDASRVTLMTVHGAKGLEFELVVLTGMEEDMFPYRGMSLGGERELEEERRLAYVAITRARSRLVVTHADARQIFGTTRLGGPSRFLKELPKDTFAARSTPGRAAAGRYIDRARPTASAWTRDAAPWTHPQRPSRPPEPTREAGERYVDRDFFDDHAGSGSEVELRPGSRVVHAQFGEGKVTSLVASSKPAAMVQFPGRGEKKILLEFLKPG